MHYDIELKDVAATPLLVVRRRATLQELTKVVPEACGVVWDLVRQFQIPSPGRHVAVYLNDEIDRLGSNLRVEVGSDTVAPDPLILSATPAGRVATATHWGPYSGLFAAHQSIRQWCRAGQHVLAGPNWEVYGHWSEDPEKLRTDIFYLLAGE